IAITYRFGEEPPDAEIQALIKEEVIARQNAERKAKEYEAKLEELQNRLKELESVRLDEEKRRLLLEEQRRIEGERRRAKENYFEAYSIAMKNYYKQIETNTTYAKRIAMLEEIVNRYSPYVDVSEAKTELSKVKRAYEIGKIDFDTSWSFYKKVAERGASPAERKDILERIIRKYKIYGFDMSQVEAELRKLR
ncbi:MAG: hypothetical protein NZ870_04885, partial [bacterium]|nr:hypothetical protein [bacterium]